MIYESGRDFMKMIQGKLVIDYNFLNFIRNKKLGTLRSALFIGGGHKSDTNKLDICFSITEKLFYENTTYIKILLPIYWWGGEYLSLFGGKYAATRYRCSVF